MGLNTPVCRVVANSADITAKILDRLISLRITDEAGLEADTLEITLADHDPANPIQIPPKGAELEVFLGYGVASARMGLFVCDEVELSGWPAQMAIRARAAPYEASKGGKTDLQTQKSRSWPAGTKLGDMVAKIAKEHSMQPNVAASLKDIQLPHFDQTEESDISFLVRVCKRYDAAAKPSGGKLVVVKRGESKTASGKDMPTVNLFAGDCTSYRYTEASREGTGTVIAYWHQSSQAKKVEVKVGSGEPVKRLRHHYPNQDAAKAAAQAELDKAARGERTFTASMPGDTALAAECKLVATGFHPGVDGTWLVKRVTHSLDSSGYKSDVECEKPKE